MADKFTRLNVTDNTSVIKADSSGGNNSIEELEDNIDASLMTYAGSDLTLGQIDNSVTETVIGQVSVSANSANSKLIIFASLAFSANSAAHGANFKLRIGTAGTTADAQVGETYSLGAPSTTAFSNNGGAMCIVASAGTDFTASNTNYVSITGQNSNAASGTTAKCFTVLVFRI